MWIYTYWKGFIRKITFCLKSSFFRGMLPSMPLKMSVLPRLLLLPLMDAECTKRSTRFYISSTIKQTSARRGNVINAGSRPWDSFSSFTRDMYLLYYLDLSVLSARLEIIIIRQGHWTTAIFTCTLHQKRVYGTQCQWPPVFSLRLARREGPSVAADIVPDEWQLSSNWFNVYKTQIVNTLTIVNAFSLLNREKNIDIDASILALDSSWKSLE